MAVVSFCTYFMPLDETQYTVNCDVPHLYIASVSVLRIEIMGVHRITRTFSIIWFMELTLMLFISFLDFVDWPFHPFVFMKILLYGLAAACIYFQVRSIQGSGLAKRSSLGVLLLNSVIVIICILNLLFAIALIASVPTLVLASILLILSIFGLMFSFIPYLFEDTLRGSPTQRQRRRRYESCSEDDEDSETDDEEDVEAVLGYREYLKTHRSNIQRGASQNGSNVGTSSVPQPFQSPVVKDELPPPYEAEPSQ